MTEDRASLRDWIAVTGAAFGAFMAVIDIQITNAALSQIQGSFAATLDEGSWISTGYLIAEIIVIPLTGWFSSIFSLRIYLALSAGLFVLFSLLCGTSTSLPEMVVFRLGQGFSGGSMIPSSLTIIFLALPQRQRPIGILISGVVAGLAPSIGPSIGGWLTDAFSWRYIFYINILPGILLIWMVLYGVPRRPMQLGKLLTGDWPGILAMAIGLGSLEVVLEEGERRGWFGSPLITDCAIAAAVALGAAVIFELVRKEPFINLRLLKRPGFGCICVCSLVTGFCIYGLSFLLPVYLAQVQDYNPRQIGVLMVWQGMPQVMVSPLMPFLMRRIDARLLIVIGLGIFAGSAFLNVGLTHDSGGDQLKWTLVGRAIGTTFMMPALSSLIPLSLSTPEIPDGSALFNVTRNLGGSLGIALLSAYTTVREQFHFSMIAERMGHNSMLLQDRVASMAARFADGAATDTAQRSALMMIARTVRREAFVMAYSDCFFIMGVVLIASIALVPLLGGRRRAALPITAAAH